MRPLLDMPYGDFEDRELDKQSLRSVFLGFLISLLLLVTDILVWIYMFRTRRIPWSNVPALAVPGSLCFLFGRTIYRRRFQRKT
jgi:hypothetical protein